MKIYLVRSYLSHKYIFISDQSKTMLFSMLGFMFFQSTKYAFQQVCFVLF